jgi:hypothetical protein
MTRTNNKRRRILGEANCIDIAELVNIRDELRAHGFGYRITHIDNELTDCLYVTIFKDVELVDTKIETEIAAIEKFSQEVCHISPDIGTTGFAPLDFEPRYGRPRPSIKVLRALNAEADAALRAADKQAQWQADDISVTSDDEMGDLVEKTGIELDLSKFDTSTRKARVLITALQAKGMLSDRNLIQKRWSNQMPKKKLPVPELKSEYDPISAFYLRARMLREMFGLWDACDPVSRAILDLVETQRQLSDAIRDDADYGSSPGRTGAIRAAVQQRDAAGEKLMRALEDRDSWPDPELGAW